MEAVERKCPLCGITTKAKGGCLDKRCPEKDGPDVYFPDVYFGVAEPFHGHSGKYETVGDWFQGERNKRYPPKYIAPAWGPGEDYYSMTAKHGVPHGPFDKERQLPYRGK